MSNNNLLDAIAIVKQNERNASDRYLEASKDITNPLGKHLFSQLSAFEQYHFEIVSAIEKSLKEKGEFVAYEGHEFPLPPIFVVEAAKEPNKKSVMKIIAEAKKLEKQAEKAYADLADQIKDPVGHDTFTRLAREENNHFFILSEAGWTLTNLGVWKWTRP